MKVKKYTAATMPEVMKKIRNELGKDAVILNSKVVNKGGILGFFMKKQFEVIAAIDPDQPIAKNEKQNQERLFVVREQPKVQSNKEPVVETNGERNQAVDDLVREIEQLKAIVQEAGKQTGNPEGIFPQPLQRFYDHLLNQGVHEKLIMELMPILYENWITVGKQVSMVTIQSWIIDFFEKKYKNLSFGKLTYEKQFLNVIGPTGVGKTTTLAKIAAHSVLVDKKTTAFITTDTYRIAAIDQLKTYASILGIPIEVAYDFNDLQKAKEKFKDKDLVLIDTAGRNYRNPQYVKELNGVLDFSKETESFLVLSLTAKQEDMKAIYEQFSLIAINKMVFTKLDETSSYGAMLNLVNDFQTGIAYLTNGQDVPDDIKEATLDEVIKTILGGIDNERSS